MELHYLEIFDTVSRLGSYKLASNEMHISQPALSNEMKKLEEQIGLRLFDRSGNGIVLNQNGMMLRRYTSQIFSIVCDMENAISDTKNIVSGDVYIGASNTPGAYIMPMIMAQFKKKYPLVTCSLSIGNTSEIADMVKSGALDAAVNGGNAQYGSSVIVDRLLVDRLVLVSSPRDPLANKKGITAGDINNKGFVVHEKGSQLYDSYEDFVSALGIDENIVMMLGNIDAIKNAVKTDIGIALLPEVSVKAELCEGTLVKLIMDTPEMEYPYSLIRNRNRAQTVQSREFTNFIKNYFSTSAEASFIA